VLSSTDPKENGIKPIRRPPTALLKTPGIKRSGVLCYDYRGISFSSTTPADAAKRGRPFRFNPALPFTVQTGLNTTEETAAGLDNDNLHYVVDCNATTAKTVAGRRAAFEASVLQLDYDQSSLTPWPNQLLAGTRSNPQNLKQFLLLDLDGDGDPDPAWLNVTKDGGGSPILMFTAGSLRSTFAGASVLTTSRAPFTRPESFTPSPMLFSATSPFIPFRVLTRATDPSIYVSFDPAGETASTSSDPTSAGLMVRLDYEPRIAATYKVVTNGGTPSAGGAAMYANYLTDNRFHGAGDPPGVVAAKNVLKLQLGLRSSDFVATPDLVEPKKAYIAFTKNGAACAPTDHTCDALGVKYGLKLFGKPMTVSYSVSIPEAAIQSTKPLCAPGTSC
jgi:hypothetical protein